MIFFILALGIALRLAHFLENCSLWLDEAYVALHVMGRTFQEILSGVPLSSDLPMPPIGFLLIEKLFVSLFGNHEMVLRAFPFLCGVFSLPLFYVFSKRFCSPVESLLALVFFALADGLVYYSSELKPYASDVFFALSVYLVTFWVEDNPSIVLRRIFYMVIGALAVSFSYPSIFILSTTAIILILKNRKDFERLKSYFLIFEVWAMVFAWWYATAYHALLKNTGFINNSLGSFLPVSLTEAIPWVLQHLGDFVSMLSLSPAWLFLVLFFIGMGRVCLKSREHFVLLMGPVILALIASALQKYMFSHRFILFLSPMILIGVVRGIGFGLEGIKNFKRTTLIKNVILGFVGICLVYSIMSFPTRFERYSKEELRPLMEVVKKEFRAGDVFYVNDQGSYAFLYYLARLKFPSRPHHFGRIGDLVIEGREQSAIAFRQEFPEFNLQGNFIGGTASDLQIVDSPTVNIFGRNSRTWIIFSHHREKAKGRVLEMLRRMGQERGFWKAKGAEIYFFDLNDGG
ncbi:MAG: glycosyltransferase family 39 protein [Candidatus Omnitrophica bacterium]|nr:glycosyltransferase family 39 protein [Candidatus Omnitrophota bacterium]